jgi:hypothetical protein
LWFLEEDYRSDESGNTVQHILVVENDEGVEEYCLRAVEVYLFGLKKTLDRLVGPGVNRGRNELRDGFLNAQRGRADGVRTESVVTGRHYRVVSPSAEEFILCRNYHLILGAIPFIVIACLIPFFRPFIESKLSIESLPVLVVMLPFAVAGIVPLLIDYFARKRDRTFHFCLAQKTLQIIQNKEVVERRDLESIVAVEMACTMKLGGITQREHYYELNLVFDDHANGIRLISAASQSDIKPIGKKLSKRLNVPLLDHATKAHRKRR